MKDIFKNVELMHINVKYDWFSFRYSLVIYSDLKKVSVPQFSSPRVRLALQRHIVETTSTRQGHINSLKNTVLSANI